MVQEIDLAAERPIGLGVDREESINLRDLLMTLWRRKMVIMGTALIVTGFTVLVVMQIVPLYVAEASVVVEPPRINVVDIESVAPGLSTDWFTQETQAAIIGSRVLAEISVGHPLAHQTPPLGRRQLGPRNRRHVRFRRLAEIAQRGEP